MVQDVSIRELNEERIPEALSLAWTVFLAYEAPDYTQEGIDEFYKSIHDISFLSQLRVFGALANNKLVGVIATRNEGAHIALFFVDRNYHRQGIGRRLFQTVRQVCHADKMTVNSSPYAVPVYRKFGFCATNQEQAVNGLRFIPMELKL